MPDCLTSNEPAPQQPRAACPQPGEVASPDTAKCLSVQRLLGQQNASSHPNDSQHACWAHPQSNLQSNNSQAESTHRSCATATTATAAFHPRTSPFSSMATAVVHPTDHTSSLPKHPSPPTHSPDAWTLPKYQPFLPSTRHLPTPAAIPTPFALPHPHHPAPPSTSTSLSTHSTATVNDAPPLKRLRTTPHPPSHPSPHPPHHPTITSSGSPTNTAGRRISGSSVDDASSLPPSRPHHLPPHPAPTSAAQNVSPFQVPAASAPLTRTTSAPSPLLPSASAPLLESLRTRPVLLRSPSSLPPLVRLSDLPQQPPSFVWQQLLELTRLKRLQQQQEATGATPSSNPTPAPSPPAPHASTPAPDDLGSSWNGRGTTSLLPTPSPAAAPPAAPAAAPPAPLPDQPPPVPPGVSAYTQRHLMQWWQRNKARQAAAAAAAAANGAPHPQQPQQPQQHASGKAPAPSSWTPPQHPTPFQGPPPAPFASARSLEHCYPPSSSAPPPAAAPPSHPPKPLYGSDRSITTSFFPPLSPPRPRAPPSAPSSSLGKRKRVADPPHPVPLPPPPSSTSAPPAPQAPLPPPSDPYWGTAEATDLLAAADAYGSEFLLQPAVARRLSEIGHQLNAHPNTTASSEPLHTSAGPAYPRPPHPLTPPTPPQHPIPTSCPPLPLPHAHSAPAPLQPQSSSQLDPPCHPPSNNPLMDPFFAPTFDPLLPPPQPESFTSQMLSDHDSCDPNTPLCFDPTHPSDNYHPTDPLSSHQLPPLPPSLLPCPSDLPPLWGEEPLMCEGIF